MSVNYMIEINALNDWELCHQLSATAYKVLCKLYYLANKERFPERITVSNRVLMSMVGCSEDSLIKARNQLIQFDRIGYNGQKKMTPIYMINYFTNENTAFNSEIQSYPHGIKQGFSQGFQQGIPQGIKHSIKQGTYILNNTIQENNKKDNDIYASGTDESELMDTAVRISEHNGHPGNVAYINGIVNNLRRGGAEAVQRAKAELDRNGGCKMQTHEYSESDFGNDFYYDPDRDFIGVQ